MKLPFFSYSKSGGQIISIQISEQDKRWDDCPATLHECKDLQQANTIAQAISNVTGQAVRMTTIINTHIDQEQVGRNNGDYFVPKQII